jgi:hypothetical protein
MLSIKEIRNELDRLISLGYSEDYILEFFESNAFGSLSTIKEIKIVKYKIDNSIKPIAFLH